MDRNTKYNMIYHRQLVHLMAFAIISSNIFTCMCGILTTDKFLLDLSLYEQYYFMLYV